MGNGARAQQKRERNADKGGAVAKSQLKTVSTYFRRSILHIFLIAEQQNVAAQSIKCKVCMQTFLSTSRKPALEDHVKAKHDGKKTYEDCFAGQEVKD